MQAIYNMRTYNLYIAEKDLLTGNDYLHEHLGEYEVMSEAIATMDAHARGLPDEFKMHHLVTNEWIGYDTVKKTKISVYFDYKDS